MPEQVQSNGLLSRMVGFKAQKEAQQKQDQIGIWKSIVGDETGNYTQGQREIAAENLKALASDIVGSGGNGGGGKGAGKGKSGSGNAGGGTGDFLTSLFHQAIDKAHSVVGSKRQAQQAQQLQPQQPQQPQQQDPLLQTPEQRQEQAGQTAQANAAVQAKIDKARLEQAAQVKREQNQQDYDQQFKRLLPSLGPARAAEEANAIAAGRAVPAAERPAPKPAAGKSVTITGPDGKQFTGFQRQDPDGSMQLYKLGQTTPLDPAQYAEYVKEPQDVTPLRSKEERLKIEHPDWDEARVKLEAAKALDQDEATKAKQGATRLDIQVRNAAAADAPAAPGTMRTLAEQWVDSGGTISIPLSYRGTQRRELADSIAAVIKERKDSGNDTTLVEQRYKNQQLQELTKLKPQIDAGVAATTKEIDRAKFLARAVPATSFKKFNSLQQLIDSEVTDDPDLAAFREALVAARSRYNAMITNMRSGGGTATNQIRTETLDEVLNRTMAPASLQRALDEMKVGIGNVKSGYEDTIKQYSEQRRGSGGGSDGSSQIASPKIKADFDALASGTVYIDPKDSKQYRKP